MLQDILREREEEVQGGEREKGEEERGGVAVRESQQKEAHRDAEMRRRGWTDDREGRRVRWGCWGLKLIQPVSVETQLQAKGSWFTNQPLSLSLSPSLALSFFPAPHGILIFMLRQTRDCVSMPVRWRSACSECVQVLVFPYICIWFKLVPVCVFYCWVCLMCVSKIFWWISWLMY